MHEACIAIGKGHKMPLVHILMRQHPRPIIECRLPMVDVDFVFLIIQRDVFLVIQNIIPYYLFKSMSSSFYLLDIFVRELLDSCRVILFDLTTFNVHYFILII